MSHSAEKNFNGILVFLTKFLVSNSFMDERGGVSRFSVKNFLFHSVEKCRGHTFHVSENLSIEKVYA